MPIKTTITIENKIRAAYEAMHVELPGLTLSEFFDQAATFYLAYKDEASFRPLVKHLGTIAQRLEHVSAPLPPINQERFAQVVSKQVIESLIALQPPPAPEVTGWRGWLIRRWLWRDINPVQPRPLISTIRQSRP